MWTRYREDLARIRPDAWRFLAGSAFMGGAFAVPWTLLQLYLDRLGFEKAQIGAVQSAEAWGQVLIALPAAFLLARRRTPRVLAAGSLVSAAGFALLPWLGTPLAMQLCKLVIGCAWWLHIVAVAPFLYRHSGAGERSLLFGLAEAVHTAAAVAGCLVCGRAVELLARGGWTETRAMAVVLSASAVLPLLSAFCYARIREEVPAVGRELRILPTARRHAGMLLRFVAPHALVAFGAGLCVPFFGLYFQDRFARSPGTVGDLFASWQLLATLGFLLSPLLVRKLSFVGAMVLLELCSIPFFLTLAFTEDYPLAVLAFLLRGALMNTAGPIHKNFMMEVAAEGTRELQVALNGLAWGAAWVSGPWIGGMLLDRSGNDYGLLMCATATFYVLASASTWVLLGPLDPRRARRARPIEPPAVPPAESLR